MEIDELDAKIIKEMWTSEGVVSLSDLAKKIFEIENYRDLKAKTSVIANRIRRKLLKNGIVVKKEINGKVVYALNPDKCFIGVNVGNQIIWVKLL